MMKAHTQPSMYIVDVIPTIKIPKSDIQLLTYFSQDPLSAGALVMVPLGNQKVSALVVRSTSAHEQKIAIKKSGFQIKGITKVLSEEPVVAGPYLALMKWCAEYYCASLPLFAKTFIPPYLIKRKTPVRLSSVKNSSGSPQRTAKKPILIAKSDRRDDYVRAIDACIASGKQTLLLVPELALADFWRAELHAYTPVMMTSEVTQKKFFDAWDAARTGNASLIIGTRTALFTNIRDLGCIIIDDEHSPHFKSWDMAPYYHAKTVALTLAEHIGAQCILGSAAPSIESYWHAKEGSYALSEKFDDPLVSTFIVDMRNELLDKNYTSLSYQFKQALERTLAEKKKAILFIARRGSDSFVFCSDCSHIEQCPRCETHLVHHTTPRRALICHQCGFSTLPPALCSKCKNPNIRTFGAGTQKVAHDIHKEFPNARTAILDADTAKTFKEQQAVIERFRSGDIDILIGTQAMLGKPDMPHADCVAVISFDNLLYLPDYKMPERLYQIVRSLQSYCSDTARFFLQTHTPDNETLRAVSLQNYAACYAREIAVRKMLGYPPFSRIVKLTVRNSSNAGAEREAARIAEGLRERFAKAGVSASILGPAPAYIAKIRQYFVQQIIVKAGGNIDQKTLHAIVMPFAGYAVIDVDPENIL